MFIDIMFNLLISFRPNSNQILWENTKTRVIIYILINEQLYFNLRYYSIGYCGMGYYNIVYYVTLCILAVGNMVLGIMILGLRTFNLRKLWYTPVRKL